jgi:hypothetical protein
MLLGTGRESKENIKRSEGQKSNVWEIFGEVVK